MREMKAEGLITVERQNLVLGNGADERGVLHLPLADHRGNIAVAGARVGAGVGGGWNRVPASFRSTTTADDVSSRSP